MTNLAGQYRLEKTNLTRPDFVGTLVVGTRQVVTGKRPPNFILYRSPEGKHTYLSSLFTKPSHEPKNGLETYTLDLDGYNYILTMDRHQETGVIIPNPTTPKKTQKLTK